jgi:CubicO group peptidase (beta-lactamase class C family)
MNYDTAWNIISERVNQLVSSEIVPGMAVGLYHQGKTYSMGAGYANYATQQQIKADTLFQIGSLTKSYTATAIIKCVDEGKLDLDAPVLGYLPELKLADSQAAKLITMRHLLNHTSGLQGDSEQDYVEGEREKDYGNGDEALGKAIAEFGALRQMTPPGSYWFYNNNGYCLASFALARILQKSYESIMRESLFAPLGLERSFFFAQDAITYSCAVGHLPSVETKFQVARPYALPRWVNGAGGIISNVEDVIRFVRMHLEKGRVGGEVFLSAGSVERMQEKAAEAFGMGDFWGLGWRIEEYQGGLVYGHGGSTHGFRFQLVFSPQHQFAAAVVNNGSRSATNDEIANLALAQYCGIKCREYETYPMQPTQLAGFEGTYQMPGVSCAIHSAAGKLILSFTPPLLPPVALSPIAERRFLVVDGDYKDTVVDFVMTEKGEIAYLRFVAYMLERQN